MEKIFNFFRFTNQNIFGATKTLLLTVINGNGLVAKLQVSANSTAAELVSSALFEFSELLENDHRGHLILHVRTGTIINHNVSMVEAGVTDGDEILLIKKHKTLSKTTEFSSGPDQLTINQATGRNENATDKPFNLKRSFVRLGVGDYSYIRSFLIQMAIESAYVISTGPHADLLIEYFKQKIMRRRKYQDDAVKSLTELGFERSRCVYAIKLKKNVYSEALNWLIDHSEDSSSYRSYYSSVSVIRTISQSAQEKFQSLNQIIRIYGRPGQHHCEKMLKTFTEMGFDSDVSTNALSLSDWDATRAIEIIFDEQESPKYENCLAQSVLESASVQNYLSDPEVFMTILYLLGSGSGSSGIEHNWESSKEKYERVALVLKKYNDEKEYKVMNDLNLK